MSFILFVFLMFIVTLIYVYITLGTQYVKSVEGLLVVMVSYLCWAYILFKYVLQGLINYDFTSILSVLNVCG